MRWLIVGPNGYIGKQITQQIHETWPSDSIVEMKEHIYSVADEQKIRNLLKSEQPDIVVICIGRTYLQGQKGNVDDLQNISALPVNLRDNLEVPLMIAAVSQQYSFIRKVVYLGTGCIFQQPETAPTENDLGTFTGSCYSTVKGVTDRLFHLTSLFPKLINVRLRMPVTFDTSSRNLISKLKSFKKVIEIPNSISVLPTLWPILLTAARQSTFTGTLHLVNPGSMTHPEILQLYKQYVDPTHTYEIMTTDQQRGMLQAERSNVVLDTKTIEELAHELQLPLLSIQDAMTEAMKQFARQYVPASQTPSTQIETKSNQFYNIMITGGCGFIGSHVVEYFYKQHPSYRIINVDKITYAGCENHVAATVRNDQKRYVLYKEDITNDTKILEIMRKEQIRAIIHLAAESSVDVSFQQSLHFTRTNVLGTHTLLQCVQRLIHDENQSFDLFLHVSTDEVLGGSYHDDAKEEQASDPSNPYSASKTAAEVYVQTYSRYLKVPCMMVRLNNVIGERQFLDKLIPKCLVRRLLGLPLLIHGNGQSRRHFLDTQDVARALDIVFHKGSVGEIYHIASSGTDHSVHEIVEWIIKHVKPDPTWQTFWGIIAKNSSSEYPFKYIANRTFQDQRYQLDGSKAKMLGFQPKVQWEQSLRRTASWYQQSLNHISEMVNHDPATLFRWLEGHYVGK